MTKLEKYERLKRKRAICAGCRDNFYNGNNNFGITECLSLASAKIVKKKFVPLDQRPPWTHPAIKVLSCHRKPGYVAVGPNQED